MDRMDALISAFYYCQGSEECVDPLKRFAPNVTSLKDALNPKLDAYFADVPKFRFKHCSQAVLLDNEIGGFDAQLPAKQPRPIPTAAIKAYGTPSFNATQLYAVTQAQSSSNGSVALSAVYTGITSTGLLQQLTAMLANITWHNPLTPIAEGGPPESEATAVSLARSGATETSVSNARPLSGTTGTTSAAAAPGGSTTARKLLFDQGTGVKKGSHRHLAAASTDRHVASVEASAMALPDEVLGVAAVELANAFVNKRYSMGGFA
eukprot:GHUV01031720.1.p2 GENE.GHUV01031720.1~~GHUV01031720.1.p2  ORF type:complete len:264 (+),score=93.56 GHUV01031720.1:1351-2142(+)